MYSRSILSLYIESSTSPSYMYVQAIDCLLSRGSKCVIVTSIELPSSTDTLVLLGKSEKGTYVLTDTNEAEVLILVKCVHNSGGKRNCSWGK